MTEKKKKRYGTIAFCVFLGLSILCSVWPSQHPEATKPFDTGNIAWMLSASGLVLLMTPGLSFFYGGMINPKNVISTMLQSFVALGVITVLWYVVGFSLAFGDSIGGFIGNPLTFLFFDGVGTAPHPRIATTIPFILFAAFQLKFAIITPALITGSFAERVRFWGYLVFISLFCIFIYCPLAHWTWHPDGFLAKWGILDFAGGTVVHISAGCAALAGAMVMGRRKSHIEGKENKPSHIPYVLLGTGLLWFGWFGFNAGSALESNTLAVTAFINTHLASAAAMMAWILFDAAKGRKATAVGACIGAVVGLVAITPAAGFVSYGASICIGFVASIISNYAVYWKGKSSIDDTLDVFPCHGVGGIVGMIFTAVFAKTGGLIIANSKGQLIFGSPTLLFKHLAALVIVCAFTFIGSYLLLKLTNLIIPLRVKDEDEEIGLDISQHNETIFDGDLFPKPAILKG